MTLPVPLQDIKVSKWFNIHLNKKRNFFGTVSTLATFFFHRPNLSSISIDITAYIVKLCRNPQEVPHVNFAVLLWKDMAFNLHACTCRSHFQNAIWPQTLKKKKRKERKNCKASTLRNKYKLQRLCRGKRKAYSSATVHFVRICTNSTDIHLLQTIEMSTLKIKTKCDVLTFYKLSLQCFLCWKCTLLVVRRLLHKSPKWSTEVTKT